MEVRVDPHALEGNQPPSPEEFDRRGQADASLDAAWFQSHPGVSERTRPPSPIEMAEFNLPPGSRVHVKKFGDGTQVRLCLLPKSGNGNTGSPSN